jgi:pyruvate/2-oxoglutarate dehydrogenase complex dihydrolipoamide dehydrogenase (E3) component
LELAREEKMPSERSYDAIIIGAGQGAKPLSMVLAKAGLKTALVEQRYVGGTCVNYG